VPVAADYPFLDILWTMIIFFAWVIWFWLLISVFADVFRRHDISGGAKTLWLIFVIVLPFLGVFIYLITQSKGIAERTQKDVQTSQQQLDDRIKSVAGSGGPAAEIEQAKRLLDSGAINQTEYEELKRKALAASA
jgi:phospholipase D-like protein/putative oligomerization/nucleic acid binding protein